MIQKWQATCRRGAGCGVRKRCGGRAARFRLLLGHGSPVRVAMKLT